MTRRIFKVLRNLPKIIEGFFNAHVLKNEEIEKVAALRLTICRTNTCGYYDPKGESGNAFVPGAESCGACGCLLVEKTACMSCTCGLEELQKFPLWGPEKL